MYILYTYVYIILDPFEIYSLHILMWFKSLRPSSCLQISEYFDWLKYRLIVTDTLDTSECQ